MTWQSFCGAAASRLVSLRQLAVRCRIGRPNSMPWNLQTSNRTNGKNIGETATVARAVTKDYPIDVEASRSRFLKKALVVDQLNINKWREYLNFMARLTELVTKQKNSLPHQTTKAFFAIITFEEPIQ